MCRPEKLTGSPDEENLSSPAATGRRALAVEKNYSGEEQQTPKRKD
jgi:hypothetical protein